MGKPYSDLEKRAFALLAGGGNPANTQDEELRNYWTWKLNPRDNSHDLPTASQRSTNRKLNSVAIEPFAGMPFPDLFAKVSISKRSDTATSGAIRTAVGFVSLTDGTNNTKLQKSITLGRFIPARVYWRTGEAASPVARTSRITKRPYKSYYSAGDEGYSAPFGKVGTDTLVQRQTAIKTALGTAINLVTFSPEKYRG